MILFSLRHTISVLGALAILTFAPPLSAQQMMNWTELPSIPNDIGVAGPFVGVHNDHLIVAGGANFPLPVWDNAKQWVGEIYAYDLRKGDSGDWKSIGKLARPTAYGAAVSHKLGIVCIGGNDGEDTFQETFLLSFDPSNGKLDRKPLPDLPKPCAFGQAALIGQKVYLIGGQTGNSLDSAIANFWQLDLANIENDDFAWEELQKFPGPARAFNLTVAQHNGYEKCVYVISGRRQGKENVEFLRDSWEYSPQKKSWRQRADVPTCVMAGTGLGMGPSHIMVMGGADGSLFTKANELLDKHPGFPRRAYSYHTITDTWISLGETPQNQVTTIAVPYKETAILASGEVRPRVRTPKVWRVELKPLSRNFGVINYTVLIGYLLAMVGIGCYFALKTKSTDDYFRGGKSIPWWAAGCSIFATMLSSLTFTGIPSKAFAQDWVYSIGNMMIPLVAFVAVFVALPFYRSLDVTSAYEYLERRFSRTLRFFGSLSFTLFHIFRMAVVMSLTGLALAVATPLSPTSAVLVMGLLSIIYCTMGGIEAVVWTDTIQTVVLLGGALLALTLLLMGTDGGFPAAWSTAQAADKFRLANWLWDPTSSQVALWVVIVGGIGQNTSSYTADQAVVQRYMTTPDQRLAARSIWTNAVMTIPATLLFFGIGTALFAFYRSHPEKLDATILTDQVFPLFIAQEMPVGIAGLIVAGIFSAAQSTVSTSMNSTATTIVTDFMKPLNACSSDESYLKAARGITLLIGVLGTLIGLLFINPDIHSLFDEFLRVVGMFMGVLGGLFVLGVLTTSANSTGALVGALVGTAVMILLWQQTNISSYLYTTCGISSCFVIGLISSLVLPGEKKDLTGLTIFTRDNSPDVKDAAAT